MKRKTGFTLIEIMVSMTLLSTLGLLVLRLLLGGLELWGRGEEVRDLLESSATVADLVMADLEQMRGYGKGVVVEGRLVVAPMALVGDKKIVTALRFLRKLRPWEQVVAAPESEESLAELLAGQRAAEEQADGEEEAKAPPQLAAGNSLVLYCTAPSRYAAIPAEKGVYLALRRGEVFGAEVSPRHSWFGREPFREEGDFASITETVFDGLLYFHLSFWAQTTTSWEKAGGQGGPQIYWDSTRGGATIHEDNKQDFIFDLGEFSLAQPFDDLFPRVILVELVVERPPGEARCALLVEALTPTEQNAVRIDYAERLGLGNQDGGFIKIDGEWIHYGERRGNYLRNLKRGVRETTPTAHRPGRKIHVGWTVRRLLRPTAAREWWGQSAMPPEED